MGKLITGSLNVNKIDKSKLIKGEKGVYLNLTIWLNDDEDQFGNNGSIEQSLSKEERDAGAEKNYLGNIKVMSSTNTPQTPSPDELEDLPF